MTTLDTCPNCGSARVTTHCNKTNDNCDLIKCLDCKGYGYEKRFVIPNPSEGPNSWVSKKFD